MKKILIRSPGSYDRMEIVDAPTLVPGPGQVQVSTRFIGVNYADCLVRMGLYESAKKYVGWPITPGFEFSGSITGIGPGVEGLHLGDDVFGITRFGAYSTQVVVPEFQMFRLPEGISLSEAAGFPTIFLTAYYPLVEMMKLRPGMRVLIHSAAGGVGSAMVQLARILGAEVTGVVGSPSKTQAVLELGAEQVIDKSTEDLWQRAREIAPSGFDVIADANGVETLKQSYGHLATAGKLVIYGFHTMLPRAGERLNLFKLAWFYLRTPRFNPLEMTGANKSILCFNLSYLFDQTDLLKEGMGFLMEHWKAGRVRMPKVSVFPFEKAADAHRALESGKTVGKLVLEVS